MHRLLLWIGGLCAGGGGMIAVAGEPVAVRAENFTVLPSHASLAFVTIQNLQPAVYQGTIAYRAPAGWRIVPAERQVTLKPGETMRLPFPVQRAISVDANSYSVEITAQGNGATLVCKQHVVCASAPYFKPTIDGDPAEWKDAIPVTFTTGGKKTIVSTYWNRKEFSLLVAVEQDKLTGYRPGGRFDAVQVAIAPQGSVTDTSPEGQATRWEYLFAWTGSGTSGKCFQLAQPGTPLAQTQQPRKLAPLEYAQARVAVGRQGATTYYECAIPWKPMRDAIQPGEGREFCLSVLVHDPEGAGVRDLGDGLQLWPAQRNRLAWSNWEGAKWNARPPWDNKLEWGLCASKY